MLIDCQPEERVQIRTIEPLGKTEVRTIEPLGKTEVLTTKLDDKAIKPRS